MYDCSIDEWALLEMEIASIDGDAAAKRHGFSELATEMMDECMPSCYFEEDVIGAFSDAYFCGYIGDGADDYFGDPASERYAKSFCRTVGINEIYWGLVHCYLCSVKRLGEEDAKYDKEEGPCVTSSYRQME